MQTEVPTAPVLKIPETSHRRRNRLGSPEWLAVESGTKSKHSSPTMNLCWPHTYSMKTNRELSYGLHLSQTVHRIALFEFHFLLEAQIKYFWGLSKTVSYNCLDMIFNGYCGLKIFFHTACKPVTSMKIMFHNQSVIMCKNISLKHKKIPT